MSTRSTCLLAAGEKPARPVTVRIAIDMSARIDNGHDRVLYRFFSPPPRPRPALRPPSSLLPRPRVDMAAARSRDLPRGPHFFPPPSTTGMPPRAARPTRRPFASASPSSAACPSAPRGQPSLGIAVDAFAEQSTLPITCRCELAGRSSELRTCEHEARLARLAARDDRRRRLCSLRLRRRRLLGFAAAAGGAPCCSSL